MPQDPQWPESHSEQTDVLPPVSPEEAEHAAATTTVTPIVGAGASEAPTEAVVYPAPPAGNGRKRRRLRRTGIIAGSAVAALAVLYGVDLLISQGDVPRGVTVAGVAVGGMDRDDARELLHQQLEPRLTKPIQLTAGDVRTTLDPNKAGLSLDWKVTLHQAGDQPLNPITRLTSFFTAREVGVVTDAEPNQLETAMATLSDEVSRKPVEGTIRFEGSKPVPVLPKQGQQLNTEAATDIVLSQWVAGKPLNLPVSTTPVKTTADAVRKALDEIAKPAVSGPVTVHGEGKDATLTPEEIAGALSFVPGKDGSLDVKIDHGKVKDALRLESTQEQGRDATIVFSGGQPTVKPSVDGKAIDWKKTFEPLLEVLKRTENREIDAVYTDKPAKVTTAEAKGLGINEVIGKFTTTGFAPDSGVNIRKVAEEVNGAIVKPGGTFSLNGHTGQRGKAQGYIPAGIILNGVPAEGVGGGISRFATTLYNASYFAGMKDAGHQEHSYYISRYPEAREATVFMKHDGTSIIDVKFTNNYPTGVAIQTIWTPSSITVKLWGTKHVTVESSTSGRSNHTDPGVRHVSDPECIPTSGQRGFTVSDTRTIRDAQTGGLISRETNTVVYDPVPKVVCEGG